MMAPEERDRNLNKPAIFVNLSMGCGFIDGKPRSAGRASGVAVDLR
jgi:hypothetical protein